MSVIGLIIENWETIGVATATVTAGVVGIFKAKKKKHPAYDDPVNSPNGTLGSSPEKAVASKPVDYPYESFMRCVMTNTHPYLASIYQILKESFVALLRETGMSDDDIQSSRRVANFHSLISSAVHRRLMPAVLEAIYDNDIPDIDTMIQDAIVSGDIADMARMDKTARWYHNHVEHFLTEVFDMLKAGWTDTGLSFSVYETKVRKRMPTIVKITIDLFNKIRVKRERIVGFAVKGSGVAPEAMIAQWNSSFLASGITTIMRG
jgi:hypothetical protein